MRHYTILALAALLLGTSLSAFAVDVKVSGYVQGRYDALIGGTDANQDTKYSQDPKATDTFSLRRARINVAATLTPQAGAVIELDATKGVTNTLAYVTYNGIPDVNLALGRKRDPFNYELAMSSSMLTTLERSIISQRVMPEYATGLYLSPTTNIVPFPVTLALLNANGDTNSNNGGAFTDETNHKLVLLTAESPALYGAHIGATYTTDTIVAHAYNVYARGAVGPVSLLGEYMAARNFDSNELSAATSKPDAYGVDRGYYLLGNYAIAHNLGVYARYDAAHTQSIENAAIPVKRFTVGTNLMLIDGAKWTVEYQYIHDKNNQPTLRGGLATQLQIKF